MISLIFDTETTGLPLWRQPSSDEDQPHLVQLGMIVAKDEQIISDWAKLVSCPVAMPKEAFEIHGITAERTREVGVSNKFATELFIKWLAMADRVVCHNAKFDCRIMRIALSRVSDLETRDYFERVPRLCTMLTAAPVTKFSLGAKGKYKWPTLMEAYKALVDEAGFPSAHDAAADTLACFRIMRALESQGQELVYI